MKKISIYILLLALPMQVFSQLTLSGEYRPRAEYRHGFQNMSIQDQKEAFHISQRTRINTNYKANKYEIGFVLQDVRVWGNTNQLVVNDGAFTTFHEAWGKYNFSKTLSLKLGRQEIIYDDHRIFGNVGWAQQARSHDAAILKIKGDKKDLDIGLAFNQEKALHVTTDYRRSNYKTFQYLHYNNKKWIKDGSLSLLLMNLGYQSPIEVKFQQTAGLHLKKKSNKNSYELSGYYQFGESTDTSGMSISAYQVMLSWKRALNDKSNIKLSYEHLSGLSSTKANDKITSFNPYFGTNHKFNGHMDYFYVGNHNYSVGLQDIALTYDTKVNKWQVIASLHGFLSANDILDVKEFNSSGQSKAASPYLGSEIDLAFKRKLDKDVNVVFGYSQFFGSESMEFLRGGDKAATSNFAYAMIAFKPTFFQSKK